MAFGDLTPVERKNKYYAAVQLGKDVKTQTELISHSTKALIATQIASTNAIIASQEFVREGIDNLSYGIAEVSEGIQGLKAAFEFGISEVVWQIEQNREVLQNILNVLMAPLDTQAKELRRRAEDAYANGWFDEALEDFLESEKKNKYDFTVHISLGMLYLFQKIDRTSAYESFEKACKYSRPKSKYHASLSLLHLALIKQDMNQIEESEKLTTEAIQLTPDFAEALYQNAQYNSRLQNVKKCIQNLERAIKIDKLYCIKADKDEMFDAVRSHVNILFDKLRNVESSKATPYFDKIKQKHDKLMPILRDISKDNIVDVSSTISSADRLDRDREKLNSKRVRNSFFDFLDINEELPLLLENQKSLIQNVKNKILGSIEYREYKVTDAKEAHQSRIDEYLSVTGALFLAGSFIIPVLGVLFLFPGWYKLWFVAYCIPVVSQILSLVLVYDVVTSSDSALMSGRLLLYEHKLGWLLLTFLIVTVIGLRDVP